MQSLNVQKKTIGDCALILVVRACNGGGGDGTDMHGNNNKKLSPIINIFLWASFVLVGC